LHLDGSPHVIRLQRSLYGTSMPGAGAVHHIKTRSPLWRSHVRFRQVQTLGPGARPTCPPE
jgi:hypothetical protein